MRSRLPFLLLAVLLLCIVDSWSACAVYSARTPGGTCSVGDIPNDPWLTNTFCTYDYLCVRNGWRNCTVTYCPFCFENPKYRRNRDKVDNERQNPTHI